MARRGKKKKSLARRIRRLVFLASATTAIVRFAMARRPKTQPSGPKAPEWAPLHAASTSAAGSGRAQRRVVPPSRVPGPPATTDSSAWVEPVDGACPLTHPVKGNANSGIFHLPGGRFYDTTVPERCYRDAEAAEADGMRASSARRAGARGPRGRARRCQAEAASSTDKMP